MKQISFSKAEFAGKKRVTRREQFLAEMENVIRSFWPFTATLRPEHGEGPQERSGKCQTKAWNPGEIDRNGATPDRERSAYPR